MRIINIEYLGSMEKPKNKSRLKLKKYDWNHLLQDYFKNVRNWQIGQIILWSYYFLQILIQLISEKRKIYFFNKLYI